MGYPPRCGQSFGEKTVFRDELKGECDMHSADDLAMCLGDLNGHMGRHIDRFDGIQEGIV